MTTFENRSNTALKISDDTAAPGCQDDALIEFAQASTIEDAAQPQRLLSEGPFVKVPNNYVGVLLDHGRASAYAIHLTAVRFAHGATFVCNENRFRDKNRERNPYLINRRGFQLGIRLSREVEVIKRSKNGGRPSGGKRRFASEDWKLDQSPGFITVPESVLKKGSFAVAMYAVVYLSPEPMQPAKAAKRFGVTARATVRKIVADLDGFIAVDKPDGGPIRVARLGYVFDQAGGVAKNVPDKNVLGKNVPAHSRCKSPQKKIGRAQKSESIFHPTPAAAGQMRERRVWLKDWKQKFTEIAWKDDGVLQQFKPRELNSPEEDFAKPAFWLACLNRFGEHPDHVAGQVGFRHACEAAAMLSKDRWCFPPLEALRGIARSVCEEHQAGREIRSLALIVPALAKRVADNDLAWAHDYDAFAKMPAGMTLDAVKSFSEWGIDVLKDRKISYSAEHLRRTASLEDLAWMLARCGSDAVGDGIRETQPEAGMVVTGWTWAEDAADAAHRRMRAAMASDYSPPRQRRQRSAKS